MAKYGQCVRNMTVVFRAVLQHLFMVLTRHVADVIVKESVFLLQFRATTTPRNLSSNFWERKELVTMVVTHCRWVVPII